MLNYDDLRGGTAPTQRSWEGLGPTAPVVEEREARAPQGFLDRRVENNTSAFKSLHESPRPATRSASYEDVVNDLNRALKATRLAGSPSRDNTGEQEPAIQGGEWVDPNEPEVYSSIESRPSSTPMTEPNAADQLFQNAPKSMPYQFRSLALDDDEANNGGPKANKGTGAIKSAEEVPATVRQEDPQDGHRTIIRSPPRNFHSGDVGRAGSAKLARPDRRNDRQNDSLTRIRNNARRSKSSSAGRIRGESEQPSRPPTQQDGHRPAPQARSPYEQQSRSSAKSRPWRSESATTNSEGSIRPRASGSTPRASVSATEQQQNSPYLLGITGANRRVITGTRSHGALDRTRNDKDMGSPSYELCLSPKQRPPSRQRHPFPQHLADLPGSGVRRDHKQAFQNEGKQYETVEHIQTTKKLSDGPRPPSRGKKLKGKALFLEIPKPEFNHHVYSATIQKTNKAPQTNTSAQSPTYSFRSAESTGRLDSRSRHRFPSQQNHDPKDDGFGAIDANTPCPFKISVTNSVAERADERAAQQTEALVTAAQRATSKSFRANPVAERAEERASQQPETMASATRTTAKSFRGNSVAERAEERAVQQTEALLNAAQRSASKSFRDTLPRSDSEQYPLGLAPPASAPVAQTASPDHLLTEADSPIEITDPHPWSPENITGPPLMQSRAIAPPAQSRSPPVTGQFLTSENVGLVGMQSEVPEFPTAHIPHEDAAWTMESWDGDDEILEVASDTYEESETAEDRLLQTNLDNDFLSLFASTPTRRLLQSDGFVLDR